MHLDKFDLNLLVGLDALLRQRSVTAAAEELHITQSAMSNALKRARRYFDDEILFFDGQKMVPTPFGNALATMVPDQISALRRLTRMRAQTEIALVERQFSIIASDYVAAVFLAALSRRLATVAPGISLSVLPITKETISQFRNGSIDFMIGPNFPYIAEFESEILFEERFKCVVWNQNPVLETGLTQEAYFTMPHVITNFYLEDGKSHFERWLQDQGADVACKAMLPSFVLLPYYVSGTGNIATVHERLVPLFGTQDELVFLEPPIPIPVLQEFLLTNRRHRHDTEAVLLREIMRGVGQDLRLEDRGDDAKTAL